MRYKILILLIISLMFALSGCRGKIPSTPYVYISKSTYTGARTTLWVGSSDPNKDDIYYIVDWGDGLIDTFPTIDTVPLFKSGDTVTVFHIY